MTARFYWKHCFSSHQAAWTNWLHCYLNIVIYKRPLRRVVIKLRTGQAQCKKASKYDLILINGSLLLRNRSWSSLGRITLKKGLTEGGSANYVSSGSLIERMVMPSQSWLNTIFYCHDLLELMGLKQASKNFNDWNISMSACNKLRLLSLADLTDSFIPIRSNPLYRDTPIDPLKASSKAGVNFCPHCAILPFLLWLHLWI